MKKKITTVILLTSVIIIWGFIAKMIIDAYGGPDEDLVESLVPENKIAVENYNIKPDTTALKLNYRDPFGVTRRPDTVSHRSVINQPITKIVSQQHTPFVWPSMQYAGYVSKPGSKKVISLISVNGINYMLEDGESAGGIKLIKNYRDSIKVSYKSNLKYISKAAGV